jgi:hypothetical protein
MDENVTRGGRVSPDSHGCKGGRSHSTASKQTDEHGRVLETNSQREDRVAVTDAFQAHDAGTGRNLDAKVLRWHPRRGSTPVDRTQSEA